MEDFHLTFLTIAGSVIVILLTVIGFAVRKWLDDFNAGFKEMRADLKEIKNDISDLKTEYQLVKSYIHEIEGRMEMRHQGHDSKIKEHTDEIKVIKHRLTAAEKRIEAFKLYHKKNHPTDEIE
jgi:predicted  nucleic acid-binding Zn-ribbon protein